jgi:TRAP-type transport system periplasmic protein
MAICRRRIAALPVTFLLVIGVVGFAMCALFGTARADNVKLRIASVAPEGSGWAREMHSFSRDVEAATDGRVQVKWYLGGVAGDEVTSLDRVKRGQLDGAGMTIGCEALAPSLRVVRMAGMMRGNAEARFVLQRMRPILIKELARAGYFDFGVGSFGTIIIFSRNPVRTFGDFKATRLWIWDRDPVWIDVTKKLGLSVVPLPVEEAVRAYEEHRIDGFLSPPGPALVFQWTTLARYFTELPIGVVPVCIVMAQRSIDQLSNDDRTAFAGAAGKLSDRFQDATNELDQSLVGGLLQKQGLKHVAPTEALQAEFFEAARRVRDGFDPKLVPPALLNEVLSWLADYRAEHR